MNVRFGKPAKTQGRRTQEWNRGRDRIKQLFLKRGITHCEVCGASWENAELGFAHSKKRRHIDTDNGELFEVALLCNYPCHREIEELPEWEMTERIRAIIKQRGWDAKELV